MHKTITNTEALDNLIMGIEKKPECCVCYDDIDKCDLVTTPCNHTFHNGSLLFLYPTQLKKDIS